MHPFTSCVSIPLLKSHARINPATGSLPITEQGDKDDFDLSFITSLEADVIPCLIDNRIHEYLITQLAEVFTQGSQVLQYQQDHGHLPTSGNPPQPNTRSTARRSEADTAVVGSTAPIGEVSSERFSPWCLNLLILVCSDTSKGRVPWLLGDISERFKYISFLRS